ncbi:putative retrotransposon-derived protein PEG10-like, partial [Puccinia sorghi]
KDGSLQLCVDYRKLKNVTRKNAYPVPPLSHLLTLFHGANFFLKLNLQGAYNLIQIAKGQEWLTAMRTRFGSFEYTVMPFGLCNAPFMTFQHFVNDIFANLVEVYVVVYLDDILVYSTTLNNHFVFQTLCQRWVTPWRMRIHSMEVYWNCPVAPSRRWALI